MKLKLNVIMFMQEKISTVLRDHDLLELVHYLTLLSHQDWDVEISLIIVLV